MNVFLAGSSREGKNDSHILDRCFAIRARQKISAPHFDFRAGWPALDNRVNPSHLAGGSDETDHVAESSVEQTLQHSRSYETGGASYQDPIVRANYETFVLRQSASLACEIGRRVIHLAATEGMPVSNFSPTTLSTYESPS